MIWYSIPLVIYGIGIVLAIVHSPFLETEASLLSLLQGFDADESDDEWEDHITWYYGAQARARPNALRQRNLDPGVDMNQMVAEAIALTDRVREQAAEEGGHEGNRPPERENAAGQWGYGGAQDAMRRHGMSPSPLRQECPGPEEPEAGENWPHTVGEDVDAAGEFQQRGQTDQSEDGSDDTSGDEGAEDWGDSDDDTDAAVTALEEAATTPLFAGSDYSSMGTTYVLLSGGKLHGCSDTYLDELFRVLSTTILPKPNSLPRTYREASDYLRRLGHSYKSYDVCPNNCRLFRGELKDARVCPVCRAPRRRRAGRSEVPYKVSRVFPITPRLKRMFRSPLQAAAMTWWASLNNPEGVMTHVSDSAQWRWISQRFQEEIGYDDRNVRMALITDGFNPNSDKRGTYSIWPILLMNYNIAPWLTTKNYFIMLAILIPGPKSVTAEHFDIFMEPLIEELLELWEFGVYCMDVARYKESSHFVLKAMIIWTIGDFPAYGILAGCTTNGFVGCPVCGEGFRSRRSKVLHKNVFCGCARRFLVEEDHHLRGDTTNFQDAEFRVAPVPVSGEEAMLRGLERVRWTREHGHPKQDDPVRRYGIKRVSSLFKLPYWKVRLIWLPC